MECKACGEWFSSTAADAVLCPACERAKKRLGGYVVERPRWISVTERLPEPNIHVLVLCRFRAGKAPKPQQYWQTVGRNTINRSKPENRYWALYGGESLFWEPTHWMPLPEPPEEEASP